LKQLAERVFIQTICAEVQAAIAGQSRLAWSIQLYLCQKYARMKLKEITAYFGEGESGFCQAVRRVIERMKMDRRLKKRIDAMEKTFSIMNNEDSTVRSNNRLSCGLKSRPRSCPYGWVARGSGV